VYQDKESNIYEYTTCLSHIHYMWLNYAFYRYCWDSAFKMTVFLQDMNYGVDKNHRVLNFPVTKKF